MLNILPKQLMLTNAVLGYNFKINAPLVTSFADTLIPNTNLWHTTLRKSSLDLTVGISSFRPNRHLTEMYIVWVLVMGR